MDLKEILRDLNVTIADIETALGEYLSDSKKPISYNDIQSIEGDFRRAIGQLKAARTSLIAINTKKEKV